MVPLLITVGVALSGQCWRRLPDTDGVKGLGFPWPCSDLARGLSHEEEASRKRWSVTAGKDIGQAVLTPRTARRRGPPVDFSMSCTANRLRQFIDPTPYLPPGTVVQGKDIQGYYPGQLGRVHKTSIPETAPGPFIKLHPAPVQHEVETQYQHDFDNLTLKRYVPFQRTKEEITDWYKKTTYKEEFALPFYNMDCAEDKYTPRTDPGPLTIWRNPC